MSTLPLFTRPTFSEAVTFWKELLAARGLPAELVWIFDENLCFEKDPGSPSGFKVGFQTRITPPPAEAGQIAYEYFCQFESRLVFYCLGTAAGRSLCLLLCDPYFEGRRLSEEFVVKDPWLMLFRPGPGQEIEEILDEPRWRQRVLRNRPLNDLDFCMTLRGIHETLAHGRVLTAYEHYALRFLQGWRRLLGERK